MKIRFQTISLAIIRIAYIDFDKTLRICEALKRF